MYSTIELTFRRRFRLASIRTAWPSQWSWAVRSSVCVGWLLLLVSSFVLAQGGGSIEEIVITAPRGESRVSSPSVVLDNDAIVERQSIVVADIFSNFTGISMRTNSRGESVVRVRGAEERQTLVFLDGAPLATPWDGRTDLALLPAGLIDQVVVTRGAAPIEYGANAVAGTIDLITYLPSESSNFRAQAQKGSLGLLNVSGLVGISQSNGWSFVAGASLIERDADRIADKSSVEFDPSTDDRRTNTDTTGNTVYAAASYSGAKAFFHVSVLNIDVDRGVAAQGDLDPATSDPRFWRTPEWHLTQATLNGNWRFGSNMNLRFTGWQQWFDQTIDAYTDYSYSTLGEREDGADQTTGARLTWSVPFERVGFRVVATTQESTHLQTIYVPATEAGGDLAADPSLRYRQRLTTGGVEMDLRVTDDLTSTFGFGIDHAATPLTGDKPVQDSLSATGWSAGIRWFPSERWTAAATLGQRSRFPTPRELYGVALGRFLLNPDLQPERSLLGDLSVEWSVTDALSADLALWANRSEDTLSQRTVDVAGVSRRQRYNTNGSFMFGVEAAMTLAMAENLRAEVSVALQDGQVERDDNGERPPLLQRPKEQLGIALDWQATSNLDLRAELFHTGQAYDLGSDGKTVRLPASNSVNFRGFFTVGEWIGQDIMLTVAVDNATDVLLLPQLGLPSPGRSFRLGFRLN
jgi:iron complex outermembrane receptor protein